MKKKTQDVNSEVEIEQLPIELAFEENRYVQWVSENGKILVWGLLAIVALIALVYRFAFGYSTSSETDFFQATQAFSTFEQEAKTPDEVAAQQDAFYKLEKIIHRHPELHAKYDGLMTQVLIARNAFAQAEPFAKLAIQRTSNENEPLFSEYSQNTLLIGKQNYSEALKNSIALKNQMKEGQESLLFGFNLLRIASLQRTLGLKSEELAAWKEWKQFAQRDARSSQKIMNHFKDGSVSLINYIEAREKSLKS